MFVGQPTYAPILYPDVLIIARLCAVSWNSSLPKIGKMLGVGFIITSVIVICLLFGVVYPIYDTGLNMIDAHPQTVQMGEWSYMYSENSIVATDVYREGTMRMSLSINHIISAVNANRFIAFAAEGRGRDSLPYTSRFTWSGKRFSYKLFTSIYLCGKGLLGDTYSMVSVGREGEVE